MDDIIKCKDCKHFEIWCTPEQAKRFGRVYGCELYVITNPLPDDYCSKAEAKEKIIKDLQENQDILPMGRYGGF